MPICPRCDRSVEEEELEAGRCPQCGYFIGNMLPGYPNRRGTDAEGSISISFEILKRNLRPFLLYILVPALVIFAIQLIYLWQTSKMMGGLGTTQDFTEIYEQMISIYSLMIPVMFFRTVIQMFFLGGIVKMAHRGFKGERVSLLDGLSVLKEKPLILLGAGILLTFLLDIGIALCCVGALVFCYWWMFTIPILVLETKGIMGSMKASKTFATQRKTFGFTLTMFAIVIVINVVSSIVVSAVGATGFRGGIFSGMSQIDLLSPSLLAGNFISIFLTAFAMMFVAMCITVHYLRGGGKKAEKKDLSQQWESPTKDDYR